MGNKEYDAVVVGAGPNGLAAAIALALHDLSVIILEEKEAIGGGSRSEELTLPGYIHDVCSSIHPLALGSPFFKTLPLSKFGLKWIQPPSPLAHPFEDGTCVLMDRSIEMTSKSLGKDGSAYQELMEPLVESWPQLENDLLGPLTLPHHPILALKFGLKAIRSADALAKKYFQTEKARGFFGGLAAHSILPLTQPITAAFGLLLGIFGHIYGWPMPEGGSQAIANALGDYFKSLGGRIETGTEVSSLKDLPSSRVVLFDLTPQQILRIAGNVLTTSYKSQLAKYRYGPGVFKIDWALEAPIPWSAPQCQKAGTLHLGNTLQEIESSEKLVWEGRHPEKPYVLVAQHSLFDPTRAPPGKHTAWAYCHVPHGSEVDMTELIENQIERFAPNFRDCVIARSTKNTREMTAFNSNYIGGDIIGGVQDIWQLFTRPVMRLTPYATSHPQLFICSSSTPPGGGVHGMCGYHAAKVVLKRIFQKSHTL